MVAGCRRSRPERAGIVGAGCDCVDRVGVGGTWLGRRGPADIVGASCNCKKQSTSTVANVSLLPRIPVAPEVVNLGGWCGPVGPDPAGERPLSVIVARPRN